MKNFIKKINLLCFLVLLLCSTKQATAQTTYSYGTATSEVFNVAESHPSNGEILLGGYEDLAIDKAVFCSMDASTNTPSWIKEFSYTQSVLIQDIKVKQNGNYIILARTLNTTVQKTDFMIFELSTSGSVIWSKTYVNTAYKVGARLISLSSGDFIIVGSSSSNNITSFHDYHTLLMKIDGQGNQLWLKRMGGSENITLNEGVELSDGKVMVIGGVWHDFTSPGVGNYHNGYIAKINPDNGSIIWDKIYPSGNEITFYNIHEIVSGDLVINGKTTNSNNTLTNITSNTQLYLRINSQGVIQSSNELDFGTGGNFSYQSKYDDQSGTFTYVGTTQITGNAPDRQNYWMQLNDDGSLIQSYVFDYPNDERLPRLTMDDNFIRIYSSSKSVPTDPSAAINYDFMLHLVDKANPSNDCRVEAIAPTITEFEFGDIVDVALDSVDFEFTISTIGLTPSDLEWNQVDACEALMIGANVTNESCGMTNGEIDVTVTSGVAPFTYAWSNGSSSEDIAGLSAGSYGVTVTDVFGDTVVGTYTITNESMGNVSASVESCDGNGTTDPSDDLITIKVEATGGAGTFGVYDNATMNHFGDFAYGSSNMITITYSSPLLDLLFIDVANPECSSIVTLELIPCSPTCELSITCPDDIYANLDGSGCDVVVDYNITTEECDSSVLTLVSGLPSGADFPLGTTTVTYQLSAFGQTVECSFDVHVGNVSTPSRSDFVWVEHADTLANEPNCFLLTPNLFSQSGNIWYQNKLDLNNDFELNFEIYLGANNYGADGLMFILQPLSSDAGGDGGGLGFTSITTSAGIEFDTYRNPNYNDPNKDHVSFQKNGSVTHPSGYLDTNSHLVTVPNLEDNAYHPVKITWDATAQELTYVLTINATTAPVTATASVDLITDIFNGDPYVYWGWGSGTGTKRNTHKVCIGELSFTESIHVDTIITDIFCEEDGSIDLTVGGGVPGYTYLWSNTNTDEDLTGITTPGDYTVTITDACGNTLVATYNIEQEVCPCEITPILAQTCCNGMDTPSTADDIITIFVFATSTQPGASGTFDVWDFSMTTLLGTFQYGVGGAVDVAYSSTLTLIYIDTDNELCYAEKTISLEACSCTDLDISITLDNYPKETSWELKDDMGTIIQSSNGHLGQNDSGITLDYDFCLPDGCYEFTIFDSYGDGICCDPYYGNGSYSVSSGATVYGSGGQFGYGETTYFCFGEEGKGEAIVKKDKETQKPDLGITNIYPNPATTHVNIEFMAKVEGDVDVEIFNVDGKLMISYTEYAFEGENFFKAELNDLVNGTYIVQINDGKKTDIQKMIVLK